MLRNIAQTRSSLFAQTNFTVDIITESWFAEAAGSAAITALPAVFCTVLKLVRKWCHFYYWWLTLGNTTYNLDCFWHLSGREEYYLIDQKGIIAVNLCGTILKNAVNFFVTLLLEVLA